MQRLLPWNGILVRFVAICTCSLALTHEVLGTAYNSDKGILEDAQVFTVQLSLSKFWMRLLDERSMKAIIDHEIAHLGQNAENLESHMLRALVDEKEKANPPKHGEEKHARKKAWQDYLYWTGMQTFLPFLDQELIDGFLQNIVPIRSLR